MYADRVRHSPYPAFYAFYNISGGVTMKHNKPYVPDEELLAAFIPKDSAQKLVQEYASLYHIFTRVSDEQLQQIAGI